MTGLPDKVDLHELKFVNKVLKKARKFEIIHQIKSDDHI